MSDTKMAALRKALVKALDILEELDYRPSDYGDEAVEEFEKIKAEAEVLALAKVFEGAARTGVGERGHTPGPWKVVEVPTHSKALNLKEPWREIHGPNRARVVDAMGFDRTANGETETHYGCRISAANATLIAAAPAMLSALKLVAEYHMGDDDLPQEIADAVNEALSQARGES